MEDLTPEELLWMEILRRDAEFSALDDGQKRDRMKEAGFPARLIDLFMEART